jgi:hypothetical protein
MAQISRPFQIVLVAMGMLIAVWFVALRGHSAGSGSATSAPARSASAPASAAPSAASGPGAPSSVYHGPAPGVEGLTRAIAKAHAAVAASEVSAKQLGEQAARASSPTSRGVAGGASTASPGTSTAGHGSSAASPWTSSWVSPHGSAAKRGTSAANRRTSRSNVVAPLSIQVTVERELKQGKVVAILFWNPNAAVDETVHRELQAVAGLLGEAIALHVARANQVGSFGSITRAVQVYQTPTILLVNKNGHTTTVTGLTDSYSLAQAIDDARHA